MTSSPAERLPLNINTLLLCENLANDDAGAWGSEVQSTLAGLDLATLANHFPDANVDAIRALFMLCLPDGKDITPAKWALPFASRTQLPRRKRRHTDPPRHAQWSLYSPQRPLPPLRECRHAIPQLHALWPLYSPQRSLPPLRERQRAAPTRHVSRLMPLIVRTIPGITQPPVVFWPRPFGRYTAHNAHYRPCGSASVRHQHDT